MTQREATDQKAEWPIVTVSEVCQLIVDCVNKTAPISSIPTPYRMIRTTNIRDGRIDLTECHFVTKETFDKWTRRALVETGDTLLTREAPIGEVGYVNGLGNVFLGQRIMQYRVNESKMVPRFLYYAFRTPELKHQFGSHDGSGSVVSHIRVGDCFKFKVVCPPIHEQKAIASVLGALDDKIELNRRMNETLEAMAQALFKSWFVDFDPVRAKMEGRRPEGMDEETAELFPSGFEESELGELPKGWTIQSIGEIVECVGGGTPSTAEPEYWENGVYRWTTPKDFSSLSAPFLLDTERKLTAKGLAKVSSGLLPTGTVLLSSRAPVGYLAVAASPVAINQGFIALKANNRASNFFILNWCQTRMGEIKARATGTTFPEINKQTFRQIPVLLPSESLVQAFTSKVAPLYDKIVSNLSQSRTLATLRDTLLPKLLSGELRVKDAEHLIGQLDVVEALPRKVDIAPHSAKPSSAPSRKATDEFVEAIVIAQLVRLLSSAEHPLGRKRYNKLAYLAHRKVEDDVRLRYLKKAAGPYSPWAKYGGPEKIAQANGYVKSAKAGVFEGLVVGPSIGKIDQYLSHYPVCGEVAWVVDKFKFRKNDDLELLATVDFAAIDLANTGKPITRDAIKHIIKTNKEWAPKLNRAIFSDENIDRALVELTGVFPGIYAD